jgi:integrase
MKEAGRTAAAREAALLRAILATAVLDGLLERNPVDSKLTRSTTGASHRPPTLDELAILVSETGQADPRFKVGILLAAYGGLRISEWRGLRRKDLIIADGRVTVNVERQAQRIPGQGWMVGPPKSAEGVRSVPLPAALTSEIEEHLGTHAGPFPDSLVFPPQGSSEFFDDSQFNRAWNRAREAAGLRVKDEATGKWVSVVREHDLRHFHLSHYAQSGATLAELKARAGHSTAQAAMIYQHAVLDRAAELADSLPTLPTAPPKVAPLRS